MRRELDIDFHKSEYSWYDYGLNVSDESMLSELRLNKSEAQELHRQIKRKLEDYDELPKD